MTGLNPKKKKKCRRASCALFAGGVASEAFPRGTMADGSKVIKWDAWDVRGHIFPDQTVAFQIKTTCGQHANQREFEHLPALHIFI